MKFVGCLLIFIAAGFIIYNVLIKGYNEQQRTEHPIKTYFSGGSNLKMQFTEGAEGLFFWIGIGGVVLVVIGFATDD